MEELKNIKEEYVFLVKTIYKIFDISLKTNVDFAKSIGRIEVICENALDRLEKNKCLEN